MWEKLKQRFSQPDDSKICQLQQLLHTVTQGSKSVDVYFTELNGIWEELRMYRPLPHCYYGKFNDECCQKFVDQQQKDYAFKFLNGLNESFQTQRSQILIMKSFPSLDEIYNIVLNAESQQSLNQSSFNLTESASEGPSSSGQSGHRHAHSEDVVGSSRRA